MLRYMRHKYDSPAGTTYPETGNNSAENILQNGNIEPQNIPVSAETLQAGNGGPSALERIPKDEQGQPLYEQADPDTAWDAIMEQTGGDENMAQNVADSMVADKEAELKKTEKAKSKTGTTIAEKIAAERERKTAIEQAQNTLSVWQKIAQTSQRRKQAVLAEQAKAAEEAARLRREQEEKERVEREEAERKRREALNGVPDFVEDTPQNARARGYRRVNGDKVDRQQPIQTKRGNEVQVKFDDNNIPTGHAALIDAAQLQPSHINGQRNPLHFIDEAQPKERNDEASVMSARKIAANIRPEEITSSVTAYTGAPTVNNRGEVIQGNNRSAALREMWASHPEEAAKYKQYLTDHAADFGLTPEDVETMQQPVLVNMLDVTDDDAITLGQFVAQDTESGGTERIKPKNIVQKMGGDMRSFANQLLASPDEEMSFAELVDRNGLGVLKWMQQKGYITPTQYKSAFDSKGGLTAEAKNDLKGIMYQSIFQGGSTHLEEMFNVLPAKAQKAILATAYRDFDSPNAERMNEEIQDSISAYYALSQLPEFANAKNYKEARQAAETWKRQYAMDDVTGESYLPAEKYSNFALLLATMYKGQSQTFIQNTFKHIYDLVQGTQEATLFEEPDNTPRTLVEAVNETLGNLREELLLNENFIYNGQRRSNVLAGGSAAGQQGRQGGNGSVTSGRRIEDKTEQADNRTGTERNSRQLRNDNQRQNNLHETIEVSSAERTEMESRIIDWLSDENLTKASGKTREEIFKEFGNELEPIAYIPVRFMPLVDTGLTDPRIYSGKGYFIDHALRNHAETGEQISVEDVDASKYLNIQSVLDNPDSIKETYVDGKRTVIFIKKIGRYFAELTQVEENGRIVLHKSLFNQKKEPYAKLNDIRPKQTSPEGGISSISHADNTAPAISLQSRDDVMHEGSVIWRTPKDAATSSAEKQGLDYAHPNEAEDATKGSGITPQSTSSVRKDTDKSAVTQTIGEKVAKAEEETDTNPTEAQKEAGNYKKGHVKIDGVDVTIENPKGSVRSGKDADGTPWSVTMNNTYGYIRGTEGVDGDHIDVYLSDNPTEGKVFVIDQVNSDGSFDEHKVMYGFNSAEEARDAYLANYSPGWQGLGTITEVTKDEFKKWVGSSHRKTKPFAEYKSVNKPNGTNEPNTPRPKKGESAVEYARRLAEARERELAINNEKVNGEARNEANEPNRPDVPRESSKAERIEKLRRSKPVVITGEEYKDKYELNRESAKQWIKDNLRGEYKIDDTDEIVNIVRKGLNKVTSHSMGNEAHLKSLVAIPNMLKNAVFITEEKAEKPNAQYPKYHYYVVGLKIGNTDYTVKITVGVDENGNKYYDHSLTNIEKGNLIEIANGFMSTGAEPVPSVTAVKDTKLISILQGNRRENAELHDEAHEAFSEIMSKSSHNVEISNGEVSETDNTLYAPIRVDGRRTNLSLYQEEPAHSNEEPTIGVSYYREGLTYQEASDLSEEYNRHVGEDVCSDGSDELAINFNSIDEAVRFEEWLKNRQNGGVRFRKADDEISDFAQKHNLNRADVEAYADYMSRENLNGAARAFHEIRRKVRLDNQGASLGLFTKIFSPIEKELYEKFGNIDDLRQQYVQRTLDERNAMEAARKRAEEAAEAERRRLQEFQDMSDEQLDSEYMKAVKANDEGRMRDLVNEAARRKGYGDIQSDYQGVGAWTAPSNPGYESDEERREALQANGTDVNVTDIAEGYSSQPGDYFTNLRAYGNDTPHGKESAKAINDALEEIRKGNNPKIKVYRAVPKSVNEGRMRNGDWVTPSRKYAEMHGDNRLEGDYRIIEQEVPANELWWDGNDLNEWGFDDGKGYAYRNTKNNRKLNDLITRDDGGNIIPLSQRFNARKSDVRYNKDRKRSLSAEEAAIRDAVVDRLRESGLEVITDVEEGQRVLDEANGRGERVRTQAMLDGLTKAANTIRSWIKGNKRGRVFTIELPESTQRKIKEAMGRDFDSHNITANGIAHALKNHGVGGNKLNNNSIPLREEDAELIPYIMTAPDYVKKASTDVSGRESVRFYKELSNGYVVVVEKEYKNSPDDMETITMWAETSSEATNARQEAVPDTHVQNAILSTDAAKIRKDAETAIENDGKIREHRVYHGSAADFEAFDHSHMGEGEGAQAYGWGSYVTEVKEIGKSYATSNEEKRAKLSISEKKEYIKRRKRDIKEMGDYERYAKKIMRNRRNSEKEYKAAKKAGNEQDMRFYEDLMAISDSQLKRENHKALIDSFYDDINKAQSEIDELEAKFKGNHHLYTVEIPDDTGENYLNWADEISGELKDDILNRLSKIEDEAFDYDYFVERLEDYEDNYNLTGEGLYKLLSRYGFDSNAQKASEALHEIGFTGIKYPAEFRSGGREDGKKNYVIFNENDLKITGHVRFFRTADGEAYGFTVGGKIYIDPRVATADTPIHEYAHLWASALRQGNQEEWRNVVRLMKGTPVWDEVKRKYPELTTDDEIADEVLATYSGRRGAERLKEEARKATSGKPVTEAARAVTAIGRVREALRKFWQNVADFLHIHYTSAEEVADRVMRDLLEGVNPAEVTINNEELNGDVRYSKAEDGNPENRSSNKHRELYEKRVNKRLGVFNRAWFDSMQPVKALQDAIVKETGQEIKPEENVYLNENRAASVAMRNHEVWERTHMDPVRKEIVRLMHQIMGGNKLTKHLHGGKTRKGAYNAVVKYMKSKHGLENNKYRRNEEAMNARTPFENEILEVEKAVKDGKMSRQDADKRQAELKEQADKAEQNSRAKTLKKDYSGLLGIYGEDFERKAKEYVADFESQFDTAPFWREWNGATKAILKEEYDAGLISKELYDKIRGMYEYYIPLKGWAENRAEDVYTYYTTGSGDGGKPHRREGRTSESDDPLVILEQDADRQFTAASRNRMKQTLYNLATGHKTSLLTVRRQWYVNNGTKENPDWERRDAEIPGNATPEEMEKIISNFEKDMRKKQKEGTAMRQKKPMILPYHATKRMEKEHTVRVMVNGKEYVIYVNGDPAAAQAVNGTSTPKDPDNEFVKKWILGPWRWWMRVKASLLTAINLNFIPSNLSRDALYSIQNMKAKEPAGYVARYAKNLVECMVKMTSARLFYKDKKGTLDMNDPTERLFKEFLDNGGETGYTVSHTLEQRRRRNMAAVNKLSGIDWFKGWRMLADSIEYVNRSVETIVRFSAYKTSREAGRSIPQSINDAKEASVNFDKHGSGELGNKEWRLAYIFANVQFQSTRRLLENASGHPVRFTLAQMERIATGFVVPMIAKWMLDAWGDDDEKDAYEELPEWMRQSGIALPLSPFGAPERTFLYLPLGPEDKIWYALGEMSYHVFNSDMPTKDMAKKFGLLTADLLPVDFQGYGGNMLVNLAPSVVQDAVALEQNVDYWGRPIYKEDMPYNEQEPGHNKAFIGTPEWFVKRSKEINALTGGDDYTRGAFSPKPEQIEYAVNQTGGGVSRVITQLMSLVERAGEDGNKDVPLLKNIPVLSSIVKQSEPQDGQEGYDREKYHGYMDEYEKTLHDYKAYKKGAKGGDAEAAEKAERLKDSPEGKRMKAINEKIKKIERKDRRVRKIDRKENPTQEEQEKREELKAESNELKQQLVEELDSISDTEKK